MLDVTVGLYAKSYSVNATPAAAFVVAQGVQKLQALRGVRLHVVVHEHDRIPARVLQAGHDGCMLPPSKNKKSE